MFIQVIVAFFATLSFAILFNVPKAQYFYCGLTGAVGWLAYLIVDHYTNSVVLACFIATIVLTICSRWLAVHRKSPITIFLISGIFPLVPGSGIYYTAYHLIMGQNMLAIDKGMETAKLAIAISLGIMFVLSLPKGLFISRKYIGHEKNYKL